MTTNFALQIPDNDGNPRSVAVKFEVVEGDITSITAERGQIQYEGTLRLKRVSTNGAGNEGSIEAGGDECYICGPPPLGCRQVSGPLCQ